jgi:hypothetical protein
MDRTRGIFFFFRVRVCFVFSIRGLRLGDQVSNRRRVVLGRRLGECVAEGRDDEREAET